VRLSRIRVRVNNQQAFAGERELAAGCVPFAVPELTRSAPIKLNKRVSLRKHANCIRLFYRTLPQRPASRSRHSRQAIILRLAALFFSRQLIFIDRRLRTAARGVQPSGLLSTVSGSWDCGRVVGLIAPDSSAHSENDRAGSLDRKPRMPQMQKDRNREAFSSKRASIP
jgi:hypothetical protein